MEKWKPIEGFENYKISNTGRIKSDFFKNNRDLKTKDNGTGYLQICLFKNKKKKYIYVHRLVALYFIDNPLNKPQVNHKDGDKSNNHIDNLEWATGSENIKHAVKTGLFDNMRKKASERMINYYKNKRELKQIQL